MISFPCPACGKQINTKDELAGKKAKCPGCGQTITIPARMPDRAERPAAEEAKKDEEKKGTSTLTKVLATVFGAVLAPILVGIAIKWGDPSLWRSAPATPAPPPPTPTGPPSPVAPAPTAKQSEKLPPTYTNGLGMQFVLVPKGTSWLGGGGGRPGYKEVGIPQDFYLGKYEVTQQEWLKVLGANPSWFSRTGGGKNAVKDISDEDLRRFPVEMVSWDDAQRFLLELNKRDKQAGWVYRLPRAAEWEYACRGGPTTDKSLTAFKWYFDQPTHQLLPDQANFSHPKALKRTCKVGSYKPNRLGLFDMHGNVFEWCDDAENAPGGALYRAARGGGWNYDAEHCRAANPSMGPPSLRAAQNGLRLARVPAD